MVPSLERAAALLDALGLELRVCRKGEDIDPRALRLAIDFLRHPLHGFDLGKEGPAIVTKYLAEAYSQYAQSFSPLWTGEPDRVYRVLQASAEAMDKKMFGPAAGDEDSQS